jgi:hypothetical protein
MLDDLKHYRADSFQLLTERQATVGLWVIVALCLVIDFTGG